MQPAWAPGSSSRGCLAQLCLGLGLRASPKTAALTSQVVLMYLCWYLQKLLQSYDENLDPEATKRAFNARSTHTKKTCKALKTKTPNPKIKTLNPYPPPPPPPPQKKKTRKQKKTGTTGGHQSCQGLPAWISDREQASPLAPSASDPADGEHPLQALRGCIRLGFRS